MESAASICLHEDVWPLEGCVVVVSVVIVGVAVVLCVVGVGWLWRCVLYLMLLYWLRVLCCCSKTWLHNLSAPLLRTLLLHSMGLRCLWAGLSPCWCMLVSLSLILLHVL